MSLAQWVEREIVWHLTDGRHALLQQTAEQLSSLLSSKGKEPTSNPSPSRSVAEQVYLSLYLYPAAMVALSALLQIKSHKIDMGALIKAPEELFQSEEEWAGKKFREKRKQETPVKSESLSDPMNVETSMDPTDQNANSRTNDAESHEELQEVLDYVADVIVRYDQALRKGISSTVTQGEPATTKAEEPGGEDHTLRNIRLNLLALAKRAPLDTIARLPKDLVPEHIRRFVPTLGGSV
jgi:bromodomain-containing protein 7/9